MKTILITVSHGAVAKNILRTKVIKTMLARPEVRVICLMKFPDRVSSYKSEISHERLIYDSFYGVPKGALERVFSFLKFSMMRTATTDLRQRILYYERGNYIRYASRKLLNIIIARPSVRRILRFFDYRFISDSGFGAILEKYRPDVVCLSHLFDDSEISLLREAKKRKIATIGFINSWDKLTARCSLRLLPDKLIVFNKIVKQEAVEHADMPEERIAVCGIPQYDQYITEKPASKEEFCAKTGLNPAHSIILFATMGGAFSDSDWEMIDLLRFIIEKERPIPDSQLFVRFQPNDFINERELAKRPWLKYDLPGIRFGKERSVDWDMGFEELKHLTDTLANIAVLISYASSISIDAAIFDKPVININFEIKNSTALKAPTFYYKTDHYQKALRHGGIRLIRSKEELVDVIKVYLRDPSLDREGRKRLVDEQCWRLDGRSGERVANAVLEALRSKP